MHQISTLLLLGRESAPAMRLGAPDWLPTLEKRALAGRGGSCLKSTLFMGSGTKALIQRGKGDLRIACFVIGGEKKAVPES